MEKLGPQSIGNTRTEKPNTHTETAVDIKKEIEEVSINSFDKIEGGALATPLGEKSTYNEQDWMILRTESFLSEHPDWKKLIETKKQWADLAYRDYLYHVKFGANIDLRNRVLDQIRFEAVERQNLGEQIIDEWFSKFGYSNGILKKEILNEYRNTISGYPEPENPSEAYTKTETQIKREQFSIDKWFIVKEITKALREIHEIESRHNITKHNINVETEDFLQSKELGFQNKENNIKQEFMSIPENDRKDWRDFYAKRLKEIRGQSKQAKDTLNEDRDEISKNYREQAEKRIHQLMLIVEQKKKDLEEVKEKEKLLGNKEKPTEEEMMAHSNELGEEYARRINKLILSFKVEDFNEFKTRQEIEDLESKINKLYQTIPYLTETGEPNKETLDSFKLQYGI